MAPLSTAPALSVHRRISRGAPAAVRSGMTILRCGLPHPSLASSKRMIPNLSSNVSTPSSPSVERRLLELKLELPPAPKPVGVYKPVVVVGHLAYASGHGPLRTDGTLITGRVGADLDLAGGKAAARQVALAMLASLREGLGSLDRIERLIKVLGLVNCTDAFAEQPKVINGFSELFSELWGPDCGVGARSAVGTNSLPGNIPVEVEAIFALRW
jgi:enamine deaminase RidA (YjgF/YER057c/UK114 family)